MHKMSAGTKLGLYIGAFMFLLNGQAAGPKARGLRSCGTVVLWGRLSENGGYWILVHGSSSGQVLQHE